MNAPSKRKKTGLGRLGSIIAESNEGTMEQDGFTKTINRSKQASTTTKPTNRSEDNTPETPEHNRDSPSKSFAIPNGLMLDEDSGQLLSPVYLLKRGKYQTRRNFDQSDLDELTESIRLDGVIEPIVIRKLQENEDEHALYEITAGERRWRAAQAAELEYVPVTVKNVPDVEACRHNVIENLQREDLTPMEQAYAIKQYMDLSGATQVVAAKQLGKKQSTISELLSLTKMPERAKQAFSESGLTAGHGRIIAGMINHQDQIKAIDIASKKNLSVRALEKLKNDLETPKQTLSKNGDSSAKTAETSSDIARIENLASERLGYKVKFEYKGVNDPGRILISFNNLDECTNILHNLKLVDDNDF